MQNSVLLSAECCMLGYSLVGTRQKRYIYGLLGHSADICSGEPLVVNTTRRITVDALVYGAVRLRINHSNRSQ